MYSLAVLPELPLPLSGSGPPASVAVLLEATLPPLTVLLTVTK